MKISTAFNLCRGCLYSISLSCSKGTPGREGDLSPGRPGQRNAELPANSVYNGAQEGPSRQRLRKRPISSMLKAPSESLPKDRSPSLPAWILTDETIHGSGRDDQYGSSKVQMGEGGYLFFDEQSCS